MAEQERIQRRKQRQRSAQQGENVALPSSGDSRHEDAEKKLREVDAAFDDFLAGASRPAAAASSTVVGQQQSQQVVKPLSDETLVRGFRQTSGE